MSGPRARLVVRGEVIVEAGGQRVETAGAVGIAGGRVVSVGTEREVTEVADRGARVVGEPGLAVVPGLHDFHLHLVGMARARRIGDLSECATLDALLARVRAVAKATPVGEWVRADGWHEEALPPDGLPRLASLVEGRLALLRSHDHHSAWGSETAFARAGIDRDAPDPPGGRFERDDRGRLTGIARERAADRLVSASGRLEGPALGEALQGVASELAALGVTGATDAGDPTTENGTGPWARFGDSFSQLLLHADRLDGRLRATLGIPAAAMDDAAAIGLTTGEAMPGQQTLRFGWAKAYADGALGSRTAALFEPYRCGDARRRGLLRLERELVEALAGRARATRIALAVHAIGDRAAAIVLDALEQERVAASTGETAAAGPTPAHRIEHLQLLRPGDARRLAALGVTASVQPVHCASDRDDMEACWPDRIEAAYPWGDLAAAGALVAFGSDAPIETANPWTGLFAAVHRRFPDDEMADWHVEQALDVGAALAAYTRGPALAAGRHDEGHLRPGARADLAVLNVDRATLLAADERLADVRSLLTLVNGRIVHGG